MGAPSLTLFPEDPTILSGTLRSTLDVFEEYQDADIVGGRPYLKIVQYSKFPSSRRSAAFTSFQVLGKKIQSLRSTSTFSVISILPYLRAAITSLPGKGFFNISNEVC